MNKEESARVTVYMTTSLKERVVEKASEYGYFSVSDFIKEVIDAKLERRAIRRYQEDEPQQVQKARPEETEPEPSDPYYRGYFNPHQEHL